MLKRISLIAGLLACFASADAQVITGQISDVTNGSVLANVSIYYDGSSIGTMSKENGTFSLPVLPGNAAPVIFSCVGYYPETVNADQFHTYKVKLTPRVTMLQPIQIGSRTRKSNARYISLFKREFLGAPADLKGCDILNMDDVFLTFESDRQQLMASADEPLRIKSPYLGYTVKYGLAVFRTSPTGTAYQGSQFFLDDVPASSGDYRTILERRKKAYYGSKLHFIRAVWSRSFSDDGFRVSGMGGQLKLSDLCIEEGGKRYLKLNFPIVITYNKQSTNLQPLFPGQNIDIDQYGFFDPSKVLWSGAMARQRIAELLPFDYQP